MSTELALTLIALLLALWALTWARRAATATERTAVAAEKSALAAERSALAARRAAEAAEASASPGLEAMFNVDETSLERLARIDAVVKELVDRWSRDGSAWPLVERNPGLTNAEVEQIIQRAFHMLGRNEPEAKQHSIAVLNMRRDQLRSGTATRVA